MKQITVKCIVDLMFIWYTVLSDCVNLTFKGLNACTWWICSKWSNTVTHDYTTLTFFYQRIGWEFATEHEYVAIAGSPVCPFVLVNRYTRDVRIFKIEIGRIPLIQYFINVQIQYALWFCIYRNVTLHFLKDSCIIAVTLCFLKTRLSSK